MVLDWGSNTTGWLSLTGGHPMTAVWEMWNSVTGGMFFVVLFFLVQGLIYWKTKSVLLCFTISVLCILMFIQLPNIFPTMFVWMGCVVGGLEFVGLVYSWTR